ncbi:hypothetical protein [Staphylococcus pseudintermedius]|uniref:hypothetical protein n=1 Tax=Staphylococcus pseudintermedius TaxID=283734 RepID=UPI003F555454
MMMERGVTMATINILNKVFSKNVLRELIREGESDLLNKAYYQILMTMPIISIIIKK